MKKLLGSLMAITLVASLASTVVACARGPRMQPIDTKFNETKVGTIDYSKDELWNAFNGTTASYYGAYTPLKLLSRNILNLLGFNHTLVTKPSEIERFREFYIGNDQIENGNIDSAPSVDGTFYGDEVIHMSQDSFYNQYNKTQINSIEGLYNLYQYDKNNVGKVTAVGAQASLNTIQGAFTNNPEETQQFINSFLNLDGANLDSAWISQKYNFGDNMDLSTLKLDSFVTPYDKTTTKTEDKTTNKLTFEGEKNLGVPVDYSDLNTAVEKKPEDKIGNNASEPFDLLLLPPTDIADIKNSSSQALFDLGWTYDKDKANGAEVWDMRKSSEDKSWNFKATPDVVSEKDVNPIEEGYIKTNESVVVPLKPLQIQYEYSTNARDDSAKKFIVDVTVDGVNAIFSPVRGTTKFKNEDDSKNLGNQFIKWQFSHYQFNDINNVSSVPGIKKSKEAENGYFSGMKITNMTINNYSD